MSTSKELAERQRKYDLLHHKMRLQWLKGKPRLDSLERTLLEQSERFVADGPESRLMFSVDISDKDYLQALDEFEATGQIPPSHTAEEQAA
ncbi:hypothetical protein [Edaphobacter modestus]|uniref:Uncharacterized protein n=2 Tax=Edaphobacter modestus TaxID=388466 RepID=A0A4V6MFS3_9BACT|nr:hypothetical protein [Edaphobacter modestus]RZU38746.1 hypothetical protein BDD14_0016 [Edaphobacter modestus]